jgi:hypothetical protein
MECCPLDHKTCHPGRQSSSKYCQSANIDQRKITAILGMKVRWIMIVREHLDDDAEEAADLRHGRAGCAVRGMCLRVSGL